MTTAQIKNLIGRVKKNNRAARAARSYEQARAVLCKTTREITTFTVLMSTSTLEKLESAFAGLKMCRLQDSALLLKFTDVTILMSFF